MVEDIMIYFVAI